MKGAINFLFHYLELVRMIKARDRTKLYECVNIFSDFILYSNKSYIYNMLIQLIFYLLQEECMEKIVSRCYRF